ncbi:MAG: tetratricopeptide repeat protein [Clostridia bacterium]|nr:tetratricopeptide repeat protein [Clostridia bacterium]
MDEKTSFTKEDYTDPQCPFCTDQYQKEPPVRSIPSARVIEKLDAFLGRNDYEGAERLLLYWLKEAELGHDLRGEFQIRNELMGLYRKLGRREAAMENADRALSLAEQIGIGNSVSAGTAYLNAATVRKAFGMASDAIPYFEKACAICEANLKPSDPLLAGLYNNMGLALTDLGRFTEARELYRKAISIMSSVAGGEPEVAVTYLNLANLEEVEHGLENAAEAIDACLFSAREFLDKKDLKHDGNYAFVCEKCAPTFGYYGHFAYAAELTERAKTIYDGN